MSADQPENMSARTGDIASELRTKVQQLLPGVLMDGVLDVDRLADLLNVRTSGNPTDKERFGLMWAGRRDAVTALQEPSMAALVPDMENSINWDTAQNVFIEGDNLEVLKLMQKAYNDQVDLVYIDPPYNTGNDFVYNDDFSDSVLRYLEVSGQIDAEGNRLAANTDVSGRKHSKWISMMYPRLMLARNMLSQTGSIFVSIDDNEVANLRLLMDEVFGPENFIGQFVWAAGRKNDSKFISESHEYIVAYCRNFETLRTEVKEWRSRKEGLDDIYKEFEKIKKSNPDDTAAQTKALKDFFKGLPEDAPAKRHKQYSVVDSIGIYFPDNISWPGGGGPKYEVLHPSTGRPCKVPSGGWRYTEARMSEMVSANRIHFGTDETTVPCIKRYLREMEYEVPYSVFYQDGRGATKRLREFLGASLFDNPKDENVLQRIIEFSTRGNSLVVDFFAGSGTTGHAVALQNERDGGTRRYVLVNAPEKTAEKSSARAAGFDTIPEITRLRLKKVTGTVPGADAMGLRCLTLGPSSFVDTRPGEQSGLPLLVENTLRENASDDAIAAEVLLKSGVRLDEAWNRRAYAGEDVVESGSVAVVLARKASDKVVAAALGDQDAHTTVFLEDSFAEADGVKTNAYFGFKQANKTMKTV
jgi:adenine-specific DNA-methyltransferase